ncbi:site-specific DNA-methyltransferase [Prevotella hominis]|uniref:site-specific DNA-methyltransferase n=1 Tax=Segatella hominis TaxID=2518605 RepID=UPI001F45F75C|nr:site-specific DNA-methyltransferase [Segatella hominis]MCF2590215.1 site-specific DNA-methyltransferase [Segatella hominis]
MDKLRMQSSNGVEDNITKIAQLFPDCVTETVDERSGQPKHLIDFEKLKQNLSDSVMSERAERYQFTWPDKSKAILLANSPINATLRPCREDSVDFDNTQNLYIEGDNLDVLKCLKETYLHKVKMIYIDPPYNTGNDFVYEDDFAQSSEEYLANSGQFDEQGNRMFTNAESNGRFHTDWLNMIYPRLKVARDLLTDDGVIFISIDDNEVENLRKVCDEVFGERNFVADLVWTNKEGGGSSDSRLFRIKHEHIVCYSKKIDLTCILGDPISNAERYKGSDEYIKERGPYYLQKLGMGSIQYSESLDYPITAPDGTTIMPSDNNSGKKACWRWSQKKFLTNKEKGFTVIKKDNAGNWTVYTKQYMNCDNDGNPIKRTQRPMGVIDKFSSTQAAKYLESERLGYFNYSKPKELIKYLLEKLELQDSLILDFFSGSASTAHAVMQLNAEDGGKRKFIMVQLPELTYTAKTEKYKDGEEEKERYIIDEATGHPAIAKDSDARKAGYYTICELGKERIRRAGKKIKEESPLTTKDLDTGFRVLKLDSTNMQDIYYSPKDISQADLFSQVDNVKPDRTGEDLLFQVMLELGATLDSKIETTTVAGKTIYNVAEGYLVACFDPNVTDEVVKAIAQMQPAYAVLRDTSMKDDSTATNFEQIFKTYSPDTVTKIL